MEPTLEKSEGKGADSATQEESLVPTLSNSEPTPRDRLWAEFYHAKIHACYLALLLQRTSAVNTAINVAIAILGSGAAVAFAKTLDVNAVVAALTLLSGALLAAKPYLPYKQRIKALGAAAHEYEEHLIWIEKKWPEVDRGTLDVIEFRNDLQRRTEKTLHKHFPETYVPDVPKLLEKATAHALAYFKNYYGSVIR